MQAISELTYLSRPRISFHLSVDVHQHGGLYIQVYGQEQDGSSRC